MAAFYAMLMGGALVMLILSAIIMGQLNSSTNFPSPHSAQWKSMYTAATLMLVASLVFLAIGGWKMYKQYSRRSGSGDDRD